MFIRLGDELELLRKYMIIQNYRYDHQIELRIDCPEEMEGLYVPRMLLQPIVENAIFHGIAPLDERGVIQIRITSQQQDVMVRIEDNGIGIKPERIKGLLSYEQDHSKHGMTHIGLRHVHQTVQLYYGSRYGVWVESPEDGGTRVTITFARQRGTIMYRVLLVDDEAIARTGLRSTFDWEKYGYRLVGEASNGQRAMKWIVNGDLDILITDIAMPVMDGLELTRRTRELCPWVKVLLLSCHSDFEYVREGIRLGASDYILKPTLDADSLAAVLDHMRLKLEEEKQMQRILTEHEQQQRLNKKKAAEKTLFQALSGEPGAIASLEARNLNGDYMLAVLQLDSDPGAGTAGVQHKDWHDEIERLMEQLYDQVPEALAVRLETDRIAVCLPLGDEANRQVLEHEAAIRLPIRCTMGLSRRYNGMDKLQEAFREASESLEGLFFHRDQQILRAEELPLTDADLAQKTSASEMHSLRAALAVGNMVKTEERLQSVMQRWQPGRMKSRRSSGKQRNF